jgi:cell division septal protein FtsQ
MIHDVDGTNEKKTGRDGAASKIILIVSLALFVAIIICATPIFSISGINVEGNRYYEADHIIAKSGLRSGQNGFTALKGGNIFKILSFRCDAAEKAVTASCPYIKTIQVRYLIPDIIRIEIEERSKSVVVPYFDSGLLIDGEGVVVDIIKNYRQSGLPAVIGLTVVSCETGKKIIVSDSGKIETALSVINALRQVDRDGEDAPAWKIATISVGDPENVTLGLPGGISVNLGDGTDLYYRVSFAREIIENGMRGDEKGDIVFTNGARPVFMPDVGEARQTLSDGGHE